MPRDGSPVPLPEFAWAASSYACYSLLLGDQRFYDATAGRYRVRAWLDALQRDFSGCESVAERESTLSLRSNAATHPKIVAKRCDVERY